ncbi:hypothetical protein AB4383_18145 [Vibrio breoganii]
MELIGFLLVVAVIVGYVKSRGKGERETRGSLVETNETMVALENKMKEQIVNLVGNGLQLRFSDIRLTRGEELLATAEVKIYKYKNTGRGGYSGLTYRIPTGIKGLNYRLGGGRAIVQKDWMHDGTGTAYLTTKAIILHDGTKANRYTWNSISDLEAGLDYFHISPNRGAVVRCLCDFYSDLDFVSLLHLESRYQNILSEISNGKMTKDMKSQLIDTGVLNYN